MKIYSLAVLSAVAAFGLAGCTPPAANTTVNVNRTNANGTTVTNANPMNTGAVFNSTNTNMMNSTGAKLSNLDEEFIKKSAQGAITEVTLGNMVKAKGEGADAKGFADMMISDHTKEGDEIKTLAAAKGVTLPTEPTAEQKGIIEKLSKLSGKELDKEYIKGMVTDHEKDVAEFKKQSAEAKDADVKAFAVKTLPTLEHHLTTVKDINAKMK